MLVQKADGSWWLGKQFEGLPITMAEPAGGDRVDDIGYGACERFGSKLDPFASTRCGYPLLLQVRKRTYDLALDELAEAARRHLRPDDHPRRAGRGRAGRGRALHRRPRDRSAGPARPGRPGARSGSGRSAGARRSKPPSPGVDALDNCVKVAHPFTPLASRLAGLRGNPGVPLVWVGEWYAGGRLTGAERTGKTAVLTYTSCGRSSSLGSCLETHLSLERGSRCPPTSARHSRTRRAARLPWAGHPASPGRRTWPVRAGAASTSSRARRRHLARQRHHARGDPDLAGRGAARLVKPLPPARQPARADLRHQRARRRLRRAQPLQ